MLEQNWMEEIIADILHQQLLFTATTTVADLYMEVHLDATKKYPKQTKNKRPKPSRSQLMMLCK